ncbi:GTP pyrophosphokinase [Ignavigranum ruoffiae]|uniref:Putative GTP pyrophosphokinase n=1 Tax=Ignavigranum ruoffiae TaxID=89093 RepID=A0A1H9E6F1_9LACT|nr:GTP pyrophosphokinase family protein [Ignavigranum ruoffiae]UPQ85334.1 GTP pyrophosphokinase family protein [Ignavigranum ruoffiae]SEQ21310.1 putative GTP pyrophosphokinase [Ignavigranum ruoffiae]
MTSQAEETQIAAKKFAENIRDLAQFRQIYSAALNEIHTKFLNLDQEFKVTYEHNPIHHIEKRLKSLDSLIEKMDRLNLPITLQDAQNHIHDIAGVRVICNYLEDLYTMERLLLSQNDVQIIQREDYIKEPKASGYRSLHVIVTIPVYLSRGALQVPVEIQFRTVAMDMWASLEHELKYKAKHKHTLSDDNLSKLLDCSEQLNQIERKMQDIHKEVMPPLTLRGEI